MCLPTLAAAQTIDENTAARQLRTKFLEAARCLVYSSLAHFFIGCVFVSVFR